MAPLQNPSGRCRRRPRFARFWFVLTIFSAGCGGARIYQAAKIPPEFLAAGVENVQTVDLSRLASRAVSSNQIGPGDLLNVTIDTGYADQVDAAAVRVGDDGVASLPLVGKVPLAGLELEDAERAIGVIGIERGLYRNPAVTVDMKRQRTNRVTVIGAVENPNVYELPRGSSSLLAALVAAGGLRGDAGTAVEIRRPAPGSNSRPAADRVTAADYQQPRAPTQPVSFHVNLVEAVRQDQTAQTLEDGDIVMVEKRDPQPFDVMGLVSKPGRFELPANKDLYLLDALAMAGGLSTQWADKAHLIRQVPGQREPVVIAVSIKQAKQQGLGNLRLAPGDVISVEQTLTTMLTGGVRAVAPYSAALLVPYLK